jgi:hypothetical protein
VLHRLHHNFSFLSLFIKKKKDYLEGQRPLEGKKNQEGDKQCHLPDMANSGTFPALYKEYY